MRSSLAAALALALVTAAVPAAAHAAAPPPPSAVAAAPPVVTTDSATGIHEDVSLDHGFLVPTALTQPAHTLTINDYEIVMVGMTYGITDRLQLSATVAPTPFVGALVIGSAKYQLIGEGRFRMAVQAGVSSVGFHLAGMASGCLSADCHSLLSANFTFIPTLGSQSEAPFLYGASWIQHLGGEVKLVLEVTSGGSLGSGDEAFQQAKDGFLSGGLRFFGRRFSADVGLMATLTDPGRRVLPFISGSFRF
jgi:hypothetical protein